MAVPRVICDANIELNYSASAQLASLSGTGTESPTSWEWTMLAVPPGSTANVGVNLDFTDGVATVQNPDFNTTASVSGAYVLQLIATNGEGPSDPTIDRESGQQIVFVKTEHRSLIVPGKYQYSWGDYFNVTLNELINTKLDALEVPDTSTTLDVEVGKHGLCPALSGTATEFLDGSGNFSTPSGVVPSAHGTTHDGIDTDPIPDVTTSAAGLCPALSNVASEYLDGQGNWNPPTAGPHNTSHISTGSDVVPILTTTETGLCPALPSVDPTTKYLRGDATWDTPATLGAHGTDHIDSGTDVIPVATAANTGLMPVRSGVAAQYLDGTGNWSVPAGGGGTTLDEAYNGGESITVDALPVTLNRTQTADDQPAQKFNHDYNGNQGTGIDFVGTSSANTPDGETVRGASISIPKQDVDLSLWYSAGGTSIARARGNDWSEVLHGTSATLITDIQGFADDDVYACGQRDDAGTTRPFLAHYNGTSWTEDATFHALFSTADGIARFMVLASPTEVYVVGTNNGDILYTFLGDGVGGWTSKGPGASKSYADTSCQAAKLGNGFMVVNAGGWHYTEDITVGSPTWAFTGLNYGSHGVCLDTNASPNRLWGAYRVSSDSVQFIYNTIIDSSSWFTSQTYTHTEDIADYGYAQRHYNAMWADAGYVFLTIEGASGNHGLVVNCAEIPSFVPTTDKVYGIHGTSNINIRMGTDKAGFVKTWNGNTVGEQETGASDEHKAVWAKPGTADLWYAIGGTTIAKKEGGSWSSVAHGLTITQIHDVKGFAADDVWICGTAPNGSNGKPFLAHFDGTSWTIDSDFDAATNHIDYGVVRSILLENELEIYVLIESTDVGHLWVGIRHIDGTWIIDHEADVNAPYYDMAKNGAEFGFARAIELGYTANIYADNPSPSWSYGGWPTADRPFGFIYDPVGGRYVAAKQVDQFISFWETSNLNPPNFSLIQSYDGGSGHYNETNGLLAHSTWHDGAGHIFHTANHSGSNHVFLYDIGTAFIGSAATTDKVFGMYGLSATDIKMGTDKTGYLKTWDGVSIGDEDVGIAVDFDQVWGLADASGTAKFEGCKTTFTGSGVNEASAVRVGSGVTHAIKADSGVITLGKMADAKHVADSGSFYAKEVSGKVEAHYKDNRANIVQLTKNGQVYGRSLVKIYFDDTTVSTTSASYVYRKDTFFYACDMGRQPVSWDVIATLWNDGGTSAQCEVSIYGYTVEMSSSSSSESGGIVKGTITNSTLLAQTAPTNIYFRIKTTGGGTAYLKYAEIYAVYEELYA